jgi:diguanylate cyclase (GGDEF)-like protein
MMLDLDHFKKINDTYGHNSGDDVLASTAHLILGMIRQSDCLIRYGGDEFLLVLPDTPADKAIDVAERIRIAVGNKSCNNRENDKHTDTNVFVTISIGVAHINNEKVSSRDFIERADMALYKAKETRNTVVLYSDI